MKRMLAALLALLLLAMPALAEENDVQAEANAAYVRVLQEGEYIPLTENARMPAEWKAVRFTQLDMDRDGISEIIVELAEWEAFVILTFADGQVYGGEIVYRGLLGLKDDGTFTYAGGALDGGVAELIFSTVDADGSLIGMGYLPLAESRMEDDDGVSYWLDGGAEETDEAGYMAFLEAQDAKLDALWYEYTEENIIMLLGR